MHVGDESTTYQTAQPNPWTQPLSYSRSFPEQPTETVWEYAHVHTYIYVYIYIYAYMYARRMNVQVNTYCRSACTSYIVSLSLSLSLRHCLRLIALACVRCKACTFSLSLSLSLHALLIFVHREHVILSPIQCFQIQAHTRTYTHHHTARMLTNTRTHPVLLSTSCGAFDLTNAHVHMKRSSTVRKPLKSKSADYTSHTHIHTSHTHIHTYIRQSS